MVAKTEAKEEVHMLAATVKEEALLVCSGWMRNQRSDLDQELNAYHQMREKSLA